MTRCEACGVFVKDENLKKHYQRVHPKSPLPTLTEAQKPKRVKQPRQPLSPAAKAVGIGVLILVVAIGAGLYYFPPQRADLGDCIGNVAYHWHTTLLIYEDDNLVTIPADVGTTGCLHTMHTHDADNVVHVEPPNSNIRYTVEDFFELWGRPYGAPAIVVDGQDDCAIPEGCRSPELLDGRTIEIHY